MVGDDRSIVAIAMESCCLESAPFFRCYEGFDGGLAGEMVRQSVVHPAVSTAPRVTR